MNHQTSSVPQIAYQSPQVTTQPMTESPLVDSGFVVPVFSPGDDPIACLNKAMFFLTAVASSRVTVQQVQRRLGQNYSGTGCKSNATSSRGNNANGQAKTEDLDTYDSGCNDISNAKAVLMANISNYGSDVVSELDLEPLAPRLLQNREAHIDYLKYTQEQADILQGIELLVYVRDTYPNAINLSSKKVDVTPKKKVKKVRFAEPLTSSSNINQVESSNTSDSNTPVLSSTRLKCSTSQCASKPTGNKKNDRISQTPSRNIKNNVEAQLRKVNKKNRIAETISDLTSAFNKKTTSHSVETQKPELKVYSRKPKNVKNIGSSKKAKIVESKNANHLEPNHTWGSNAIDIPSSSSLVMTGTVRFGNDHITRIMGYGDYQLGNVTISRVYYVEGLGHNLFSVGQFCDADIEVAFQKNTRFIRNLKGVDLLSESRDTNLYIISLDDIVETRREGD
ncbi:hypothetical protein Tco_1020935 [Tanacetum coccineum]